MLNVHHPISTQRTLRRCKSQNFSTSLVCSSNPLLRWLSGSAPANPRQQQLGMSQATHMERLRPREYQKELIQAANNANVLVALPTGSGKTLIAAEIIQQKAAAMRAAGKYIIFLAPTNPLVEQQCNEIFINKHGLTAIAFHGDVNTHKMTDWNANSWQSALSNVDVAVMTPQILLLALVHGSLQMHQIGLLIFDECHHCDSNHPYNQIMTDFYDHGRSSSESRPQILALTASPKGLEGSSSSSSQEGLQYRLGNARLVTVAEQCRFELNSLVPVPADQLVDVDDVSWSSGLAVQAAAELETAQNALAAAADCEDKLYQLQHHAMMVASGQMKVTTDDVAQELKALAAATNQAADYDLARLKKQFRAVCTCLSELGPWPAAAAAYLDLMAGSSDDNDVIDRFGDDTDHHATAAMQAGREADDESEDGTSSAAAAAGAGSSVLQEGDMYKLMKPDHLDSPETLLEGFRDKMITVYNWLQQISSSQPHIILSTDLHNAMAAAAVPGSSSSSSGGGIYGITADSWAAAAGGLLSLMTKAAVMMAISVLADLLITDDQARKRFITDPGLHAAASDAKSRAEGGLRHYVKMLMEQVAFATLQAQIFPNLPSSRSSPAWSGAPLLSPKVVKLIQHLEYQRMELDGNNIENNNSDDWWACIVFVETKLATLVLHKLLRSLPDVSRSLRAGYLVGDTEYGGGGLSMSNKAQARMVDRFRTGELNVLIATNIGNEGLDFKQCQAVVAFDPPTDVTCYIQARGRARKCNSHYCWMAPQSVEADVKKAVSTKLLKMQQSAQRLDDFVQQWSLANRTLLQQQQQSVSSPVVIQPYDPLIHFPVSSGGVATLRQAQVLLAAFCARLPGSTSASLLQAYYTTKLTSPPRSPNRYVTTVYLPSNSGITQPITGPEQSKKTDAKSAAALAAIKKLYEMKKLDEYLQPVWISNRRPQQLEAEPIPKFTYDFSLEFPLGPRTVNFTPLDTSNNSSTGNFTPSLSASSAHTVTMHLHYFSVAGSSSSSSSDVASQQQQHLSGSKRPLSAVTAALQNALQGVMQPVNSSSSSGAQLLDLLNLAVGSLDRCAAVPGSSSSSSSVSSSSSSSKVLSFGVLLWEPLSSTDDCDNALEHLHWPAWSHQQQQQPHQVSVVYAGPVTLTAADVLQLMHYQQAVDDHVNWSSKRLLGLKTASQQQQQQQQQHLRPFEPDVFRQLTANWRPPTAAAADVDKVPAAAAAQLLNGAQVCYMFVPLLQQQGQQQQQQCRHLIDWQGIGRMSEGLKSFTQLAAEVCHTQQPAAAAAAMPDQLTAEQVHALTAQLRDRIVIAGHSSMMYRCGELTPEMTPQTPAEFEWKGMSDTAAAAAVVQATDSENSSSSSSILAASCHAEYYSKRYNVTNLNPELPMMSVAGGGQGWKKGLGLVSNTLKPPVLQKRVTKGLEAAPADLTSPEAAAAAVRLFGVTDRHQQQQQGDDAEQQQQQQQRSQEYLPLELCWILPLTAAAWSDLLLLPAFMYRINALLRVRRMHQHLQQQAQCTPASSSSSIPRFPVPDRALLLVALTGSSAGEVFDQEGLEYLGDVVLKFLVTNYLLQSEPPTCNEGELSVKKARMVRNVQLAAAAQQQPLLLQQHLHLLSNQQTGSNRGGNMFTPTGWYPGLAAAAAAGSSSSGSRGPIGLNDSALLREEKGKRLADGVEALIGAVYLTAAAAAGDVRSAAAAAGSSGVAAAAAVPVSMAGLKAAAAFCEAVGVMPEGSAAIACQPPFLGTSMYHQQQQQQRITPRQQQQSVQQILHYTFRHPDLLHQALTHVSVLCYNNYQRLEFLGDAVLDLMVSGWMMTNLAAALRQQQQQQSSVAQVYAPAVLTQARAALVNNTNLGRAAAAAGLQHHLNARSKPLHNKIRKFVAAVAGHGRQQQQQGVSGSGLGHAAAAVLASSWTEIDLVIWQQVWDDTGKAQGSTGSSSSSTDADTMMQIDDAAAGNAAAVSTSNHPRPPKALADVIESLVGAVFVDSMRQQTNGGWEATWAVVRRLLGLA